MSKQSRVVHSGDKIFLLFVKAPKCQPPGPLGSVVLGQNMDISGRREVLVNEASSLWLSLEVRQPSRGGGSGLDVSLPSRFFARFLGVVSCFGLNKAAWAALS